MAGTDVIGVGGDSSCSSLTNFQTIPYGMSAGYSTNDDAFYQRHSNRNRIAKR